MSEPILSAGAEDLFLEAMVHLDSKYYWDKARFPHLYELAIALFPAIYGRLPCDVPQFVERVEKKTSSTRQELRCPVKAKPLELRTAKRDYVRAQKSLSEFKAWLAVELSK